MTILPNTTYRYNMISIKLPMAFFTEPQQKISQLIWKHKRPSIVKTVLRKKNGAQESTFLTSDYTTRLQSSRQCPAAAAKLLQFCLSLCDSIDSSPPGSPVPGILQARTLEWVAISFSNAWKWQVKVKSLSRVRLFLTPRTVAYQPPPSMGPSRQEYWSGLPFPSLQDSMILAQKQKYRPMKKKSQR